VVVLLVLGRVWWRQQRLGAWQVGIGPSTDSQLAVQSQHAAPHITHPTTTTCCCRLQERQLQLAPTLIATTTATSSSTS
jgi:hypothetical protein